MDDDFGLVGDQGADMRPAPAVAPHDKADHAAILEGHVRERGLAPRQRREEFVPVLAEDREVVAEYGRQQIKVYAPYLDGQRRAP